MVRTGRLAGLGVAVVRAGARNVVGDRHALDQVPVRGTDRVDVHVERQQEELAVAVGDAAVRDDAEVLEDAAVGRLEPPHDLTARGVDAEDVVVVRRDVELSAHRDRVGLLADLDAGVDRLEVHRVGAAEL
jgi:hypothetical protein